MGRVHGQSLGGALATLAAVAYGGPDQQNTLWASPRVFSPAACAFAAHYLPRRFLRLVNESDLVPDTPPAALGWAHLGAVYPVVTGLKDDPYCSHVLASYLHGLDPTFPPEAVCVLPPS